MSLFPSVLSKELTPVPVNLIPALATSPSTTTTLPAPPFANLPVGFTRSTSTSNPGAANLLAHPFPSSKPISPTLNLPELPELAFRPEGTGTLMCDRPEGTSTVTFSDFEKVEVRRYVTRSGALPFASIWRSIESPEQAYSFCRLGEVISTLASGWTVCSIGGLSSCCRT